MFEGSLTGDATAYEEGDAREARKEVLLRAFSEEPMPNMTGNHA